MKKIIALALAVVSTMSMFAVINSQLTIYLDSESDKEVEARVACGDSYSPFNAASCASFVPMYSNASNIGMYVRYENNNYSELYAPELKNVPLVVVTSREAAAKQNYTFFVELGANNSQAVYVTDLRPAGGGAPVTFQLKNDTEYSFSLKDEAAFVEGANSVIADRFVINYDPSAIPSTEFEICHLDGKLTIVNNPYPGNIVIKDAEGNQKMSVAPDAVPVEGIDLSTLSAGRYTVEIGDKHYVIIVK